MTTYCNCNNSSSLSSVAIYYSSYESLVSKFDHYLPSIKNSANAPQHDIVKKKRKEKKEKILHDPFTHSTSVRISPNHAMRISRK